jgi:type I restriction enzyme R subunit
VLFLVDRSALGQQARDAFAEMRLENLQTFAQNYDVMGLEGVRPPKETKVHVATVQGMVQRFLSPSGGDVPISDAFDTVISVEHGYGGGKRPADYLAAFQQFIEDHRNEIAALTVVCTRPRELTRAQLRELKLKLDAAGYPEAHVRTAFRDATNLDIAATIIGFIRQRALGSPLVPYADRVDRAVTKLVAANTFTPPQKKWLERIAAQLKQEVVVDTEAFDRGAFANHGGWKNVDKAFGGRLQQVMNDLGDEVWTDAVGE